MNKKVPVEVYSRVVGYYRPVKNWNRGKREEFRLRRTFEQIIYGQQKPKSLVAGFIGVSLIDYPEKTAATLFTYGCNLRCPYCQNPELVVLPQTESFSEDEILQKLKERQNFIDGVCITGGEPTLYPDLKKLIEKIKDCCNLKIKIDTNGTSPDIIKQLIDNGLIDYIAMDVKAPLSRYAEATGKSLDTNLILQSIDYILSSDIDHEFRTTCYPEVIDKDGIDEIGKYVYGANLFAIQQFHPHKTIAPEAKLIVPYTLKELNEFKTILEKYVKKVVIRGA